MNNLLLIDFSSVAYPIWHMAASDPNPNATSTQILERIRGLASGYHSGVAICVDSKKSVRREADPTYKANRKAEDRAPLYHQMDLALATLGGEGFPIWEVEGFEADDVVASATMAALKDRNTYVLIASADKDLLALVDDRVKIKSLRDGSELDAAAVQLKFGVRPDQIPDYLALVGDASDNIRGATKIGPVTAVKLLSAYDTLEGVYMALNEDESAFSPGVVASLNEFISRIDEVRSLIRLRTNLEVPLDEIFVERRSAPALEESDPFAGDDAPKVPPATLAFPPPTPVVSSPAEVWEVVTTAIEAAPQAEAPASPQAAPAPKPTPARGRPRRTPEAKQADAKAAQEQTAAEAAAADAQAVASLPQPETVVVVVEPESEVAAQEKPTPPGAAVGQRLRDVAKAAAVAQDIVPGRLMVLNTEYTRQLEPQSMDEAKLLAKHVYDSHLFGAYGSAQAVLMSIMAGRELGMPTMHSLRAFHIVESKPVLAADAIRALVLRSGKATYFRCAARSALLATFVTKRGDDPEISLTYSIEEAAIAGLLKAGSGWVKNPADMLVARSSSKLARLVYPDVVHGVYAPEEIE